MPVPRLRTASVAACLALAAAPLGACGDKPTAGPRAPAVATSAADAGGMAALTAAAEREGSLNTIALPSDWANYGALIDGFEKKYGIKVLVENPEGTSQDEINALKERRGEGRAPDVIDVGGSFAQSAARQGLLAPYEVALYDQIPKEQKDPKARWYNNYGGYISIGCDAKRVKTCPSTFADLRKPEYKGQVALNGDPTKSGSAFAGVYAAALANGVPSTTSSPVSTSSPSSARTATSSPSNPPRPRSRTAGPRSASTGTSSTSDTPTSSARRAWTSTGGPPSPSTAASPSTTRTR